MRQQKEISTISVLPTQTNELHLERQPTTYMEGRFEIETMAGIENQGRKVTTPHAI